MPLCHERRKHLDEIDYQQIEEFFMKLKELGQHFGSDEFKNKLFGEKMLLNMTTSQQLEDLRSQRRRSKLLKIQIVVPIDHLISK